MKTILTMSPREAAEIIRRGGIVAFPTETVYGLGAHLFDEAAIKKIFEAKQRPADNPLIAHVGDVIHIKDLAGVITPSARSLIDAFFPGPLTVVLPKAATVPLIATAGLDTIGVRMPSNRIAREFLAACGAPVVAPSANISGRPSPTTWTAVLEDLDGRIDGILQGDQADVGIESTVVDCTVDPPVVLRKGAVSLSTLQSAVPDIVDADLSDEKVFRSPGLRHKHYSPRATVVIAGVGTSVGSDDAFIGLQGPTGAPALTMICSSVGEYAHRLFEFFRECDRRGIKKIVCESVDEEGIGAALMDRIRRAAAN
ncbi:MAG TPA: L-threonylcarbamoyladenylate synthase [Pyrinomonadaceae bacterium]|nr:L-threonylcarbamoyladenylate synthase [Pyrinomonadaceae bacterium]